MSAATARRVRRTQRAWRVHEFISNPEVYRFGAAVLATSTIISSLIQAMSL